MSSSEKYDIRENLTDGEKEMIINVMSNYNLQVVNINKARSAYKVETETGLICLKRMKHGIQKSKNGSILVEELYKNGFINTPKYIHTTEDNIFVKNRGSIFYATEWISGEECNLNDLSQAKECIKLLAKFHIAAANMDISKLQIRNNLKNWPQIFNSNIYDLEKFKKIIERKKTKAEFDIAYLNCIDNFYSRGITAIKILNESNYFSLSKAASSKKTICHDSFYYQNVIKVDNLYYIVDLDSIIIDLHINDVGKVIRRLMFKNEYQWDFEKAKEIIESYNTINKLSKEELEAMLALIIFPHKFWKLGKKRYIKCKNWDESKYMHKLNRLIKYNEFQQKFLEDYLNYIQQYI